MIFIAVFSATALANGLSIKDARISVDYDEAYTYRLEHKDRLSSESGLGNGSTIKAEILPGSAVTLTFWIENTFPNNGIDISGILPKVTIKDLDDDSDVEIEDSDIDLDAGNDARVDINFLIPLDADAITYDLLIEAIAEKNNTDYDTEFLLKMPVRRQSHDIRITSASLNPGIIQCDRKIALSAKIANAGSSEEPDLALEFKSTALNINNYEDRIYLDSSDDASIEDRSFEKTINFEVPKFVKAGKYPVMVNLYWKKYILFDRKQVDLIVRDCETAPNAQSSSGTGNNNNANNGNSAAANTSASNGTENSNNGYSEGIDTTFESFLSGNLTTAIIFAGALIFALIIAALVIFYPRK